MRGVCSRLYHLDMHATERWPDSLTLFSQKGFGLSKLHFLQLLSVSIYVLIQTFRLCVFGLLVVV